MSYHHSSQLWSSQFGVRFGALANVRQEPTSSTSLHTSTLGGDEIRTDSPVNPAEIGLYTTDVAQDPLPSFPRSRSPRRAPIALPLPPRPTDAQRPPIALPDPNVATSSKDASSKESAAAPAADKKKIVVEPPSTSLEFSISKKEFLAARAAIPGTPEAHWSYAMYHRAGENGKVDNVKVHYCENKATTERVCNEYFLNEDVIGLDLEWMKFARRTDGPRQNVSLIQIASPSRIALIHVAVFTEKEDFLGPSFRRIMENPNVSKVGVNIIPDCTRLKNHLGVTVRGVFELSHLYRVVKYLPQTPNLVHKGLVALATQVEDQLLLPLYKGDAVRTGNWMRRLSSQQINYAASDAYAGLQLYYVLEEKRKALVPCPPRPHHAELRLPIPLPAPPAVEKKEDEDATVVDQTTTTTTTTTITTAATATATTTFVNTTASAYKRRTYKPRDPKPEDPNPIDSKPKRELPNTPSSKLPASEASASGDSAPTVPKAKRQRPPKPPDTRDARVIAAEAEMKAYNDAYTAANSTWPATTPVRIRAYYIWYRNEDLCPADIAALLRDPPLLTSTVASYIVDAIQTEKFPYPLVRLHKEVVCHIDPEKPYMLKYKSFCEECSKAVKLNGDDEETKQTEAKPDVQI
ncbi:uncharacterized protein Triagg1_6164 [Trichoderma aggressivum f. europaeum]|uniref:3'-5' exonuclease domain-containing protein n=1 Tax=Trichoderma aggressivum f. europaeum TaxID=173218 RepID=A0AAE1IDQ2_9HYPO|nr:hypothetical protein Triagg1_6164 [Trichoderma aggressivum f. europaeum]